MYETIRFDRLETMLDAAQNHPNTHRIDMGQWFARRSCGTAGCLVGTYGMAIGDMDLWDQQPVKMVTHFGLSIHVFSFLFTNHHERCNTYSRVEAACYSTESEAVARLEKSIKTLKRQRDLWRDHQWWMSLSRADRRRYTSPATAKTELGIALKEVV